MGNIESIQQEIVNEFDFFDDDGWPHYKTKEELPTLKPGEQSILMKESIVQYFKEKELI